VAQGLRSDRLGYPGPPGYPANHPGRGVAVEAAAVACYEDRPFASLPDGQVHGPGGARRQRDRDDLTALAKHGEGAVAALDA
jgi:hypothetical protein